MLKKIFLILLLLISPVFAGEVEDAAQKNDRLFIYFYAPSCSTCNKFNEIYNEIKKESTDFGFVKLNAETPYGSYMMVKYHGLYVPYIILTDFKKNKTVNVNHSCAMDSVCLLRAMKSFKK